MKRKIFAMASALTLCAFMTVNSFAANINVKVDEMLVPMNKEVINKDGYNLVAFSDLAKMFGAEIDYNDVKKCITAKKNDKTIIVYLDTNRAVIDGEGYDLPVMPEITSDKDVMVPVRFIGEAFDAKVDWNEKTKTVSINRKDNEYLVLDLEDNVDENTKILSYEEAVKLAEEKSSSLKNYDDTITYMDDVRDDLSNNIKALDSVYATYSALSKVENQEMDKMQALYLSMEENINSTVTVMRSMKDIDKQLELKDVNIEMMKDGIALSVKSYFSTIKGMKMQISLLEESIALGAENIKNIELKNSLGMESDYSVTTAKMEQEQKEKQLESLKLSLENQYASLKNLIGIDADTPISIDYEIEFNQLTDVELEPYIKKKIQNDPSIKVLKSNVEVAQYGVRTGVTLTDESRLQMLAKYNEASRSLKDTQDSMATNIRNTYNSLKQLEETNNSNKIAVRKAIEDYNKAVTNYKAGMITEYQVKQARLAILNAEMEIESNALNYDMMVFSFERPYLLSGNSAGSSKS